MKTFIELNISWNYPCLIDTLNFYFMSFPSLSPSLHVWIWEVLAWDVSHFLSPAGPHGAPAAVMVVGKKSPTMDQGVQVNSRPAPKSGNLALLNLKPHAAPHKWSHHECLTTPFWFDACEAFYFLCMTFLWLKIASIYILLMLVKAR